MGIFGRKKTQNLASPSQSAESMASIQDYLRACSEVEESLKNQMGSAYSETMFEGVHQLSHMVAYGKAKQLVGEQLINKLKSMPFEDIERALLPYGFDLAATLATELRKNQVIMGDVLAKNKSS